MRQLQLRALPQLDSMRFFAASSVLLHHYYFKSNSFFLWFERFGNVGVDIFFVLSGFIITTGIVNSFEKGRFSLRAFLIRRCFRLWPSLFIAMLASTAITLYFARTDSSIYLQLQSKIWHYFLHFGNYSYAYYGKLHHVFGHYWTLSIEEHFYVLWPLLFFFCGTHKQRRYLCLGLMIVLPYLSRVFSVQSGAGDYVIAFATHNRIDALAIGCALALVYPRIPKMSLWMDATLFIAMLLFMYLGLSVLPQMKNTPFLSELNYTLVSLGSCCLIVSSLNKNGLFLYRLMSIKIFAYLGLLSYGVYLFHIHTHTMIFGIVARYAPNTSHELIALIGFILPYIPAYLVYVYVDQYFMSRRERVIQHFKLGSGH